MKEEEYNVRLNHVKYLILKKLNIPIEKISDKEIIKFLIEEEFRIQENLKKWEEFNNTTVQSLVCDRINLISSIEQLRLDMSLKITEIQNKFPNKFEEFDFCIVEHIDENGNKELISSCDKKDKNAVSNNLAKFS